MILLGKEYWSIEDGYQGIKLNQRKDQKDRWIFFSYNLILDSKAEDVRLFHISTYQLYLLKDHLKKISTTSKKVRLEQEQ